MKSFARSVATITAFAVVTRGIGFVFRIFMSRSLGAEMMGIYQVAFSLFIVLLAVVSSGVPLVVSARSAALAPPHRNSLVTAGFLISAAIAVGVCVTVFALKKPLSHLFADARSMNVLLLLLPAVLFSALGAAFQGAAWGGQSYGAVSGAELVEQLVRVTACVVGFLFFRDALQRATVAAASLSLACLVSSGLMVVLYQKKGGRLAPFRAQIRPLAAAAAPISVMRVLSCLVNSLVAIIIPARLMAAGWSPENAMTAYGASVGMAMSLVTMPLTLTGSLSMALVPELSGALSRGHTVTVKSRVERAVAFAGVVSLTVMPVYIGFGRELGMLLYGSAEAGIFLRRCAILMLPLAIEQITSSMMNSLGLERKAFVNFLCGSAALLVCLWFLPAVMGMDALIVGMTVSYALSALLHLLSIRKKVGIRFTFLRTAGLLALFAVPASALGLLVHRLTAAWGNAATTLTGAFSVLLVMFGLMLCFDVISFAHRKSI
ncbi:MAG: oligosaccharide flippase family protein [Clostridiales bacterium]|jgi:stage V sporulation protein B|nr:oligosaccharide flippase family protein [Clostridiales bacterium]